MVHLTCCMCQEKRLCVCVSVCEHVCKCELTEVVPVRYRCRQHVVVPIFLTADTVLKTMLFHP